MCFGKESPEADVNFTTVPGRDPPNQRDATNVESQDTWPISAGKIQASSKWEGNDIPSCGADIPSSSARC